jgi:hypothetical protein
MASPGLARGDVHRHSRVVLTPDVAKPFDCAQDRLRPGPNLFNISIAQATLNNPFPNRGHRNFSNDDHDKDRT